jgi:hypothetical protein
MAALAVGLVVGFNAVASGLRGLLTAAGGDGDSAAIRLIAAVAGCVALLLIYRLAVAYCERRDVKELELREAPKELLIGITVGAALMTMIVGALWMFGWVGIDSREVDGVALALRDSLRSGVVEEALLRLVIFRLLWRALGIYSAIALAAILFGILHLGNPDSSPFALASLIAGEGIMIGLYLLTGRIWASIGAHAAWNFTQGWIFGAAVSGTSEIGGGPLVLAPAAGAPELLSGGGFGPEASVAALAVSLLASVLFLGLAWRRGDFVPADQVTAIRSAHNQRRDVRAPGRR